MHVLCIIASLNPHDVFNPPDLALHFLFQPRAIGEQRPLLIRINALKPKLQTIAPSTFSSSTVAPPSVGTTPSSLAFDSIDLFHPITSRARSPLMLREPRQFESFEDCSHAPKSGNPERGRWRMSSSRPGKRPPASSATAVFVSRRSPADGSRNHPSSRRAML